MKKYFLYSGFIVFIVLTGCTNPVYVAGSPEYISRVAIAEAEAQNYVKQNLNTVIIRSTAKVLEIKIITEGNEQIMWSPGPIKSFTIPQKLSESKSSIYVLAHWDNGEWEKNHCHIIEYYENGKLTLRREARGVGVYKVLLLQNTTLIAPL